MKNTIFALIIFIGQLAMAQSKTITVKSFDKVIISPHIQANFVKGNSPKVVIEKSTVATDKVNVEVNGKTLRIYLDDAKEVTKSEEYYANGQKRKRPIYKGTVLTATVTYTTLEELSLRGEETVVCKSPIDQEKFRLKIYGESQVYLNEVKLQELHTTIYGESVLEVKKGSTGHQKFTAYGETKINTLGVANKSTKITAYGEGSYRINASDRLKVTAYGEATVAYQGNPDVDRGIIIGEATIQRID